MLLHIIRHADPDYARDSITPRGVDEAKALADRLARRGIEQVYTSPLGRAVATAEPTAALLGMTPTVLDWAREFDSPLVDDGVGVAGLAFWNVAGQYLRGGGMDLVRPDRLPIYQEGDAHTRIAAEIDRLRTGSDDWLAGLGLRRDGDRYRRSADVPNEVAVFCHGGLAVTWVAHLLGIPVGLAWCGMYVAPTSVSTVVFESRTPDFAVPRLIAFGDTSHIYAANLPENLSGIPGGFA
ncbi:histidine phosphatase family protein [Micromonospora echinospora]|uniref:histidine phosphatase family protein n=1 Tax=Micromonospora echinospora TaxID=1877 RepID=UPI0037AA683B